MTITDKHILFWGDWPSNFAWAPMKTKCLDGQIHEFFSSEQCYMWHKAYCFNDMATLNEIEALNSYKAKKLGRMVEGFNQDEWNKISYNIMLNACLSKYSQNKILFDKITDPALEGKKFVEASPVDKIWGVGLGEFDPLINDEANWKGENRLGKVLDEVRARKFLRLRICYLQRQGQRFNGNSQAQRRDARADLSSVEFERRAV